MSQFGAYNQQEENKRIGSNAVAVPNQQANSQTGTEQEDAKRRLFAWALGHYVLKVSNDCATIMPIFAILLLLLIEHGSCSVESKLFSARTMPIKHSATTLRGKHLVLMKKHLQQLWNKSDTWDEQAKPFLLRSGMRISGWEKATAPYFAHIRINIILSQSLSTMKILSKWWMARNKKNHEWS